MSGAAAGGGGAAAGAAAAAAAGAAKARAIRASGTIVRLGRQDFLAILERSKQPLVVRSTSGFFGVSYKYLTSYKGLAFFLQSSEPLELPAGVELMEAERIWIP